VVISGEVGKGGGQEGWGGGAIQSWPLNPELNPKPQTLDKTLNPTTGAAGVARWWVFR
jgi:hypothetical protein